MFDRWVRLVPITGVLTVGLLVATIILSGSTPDHNASGSTIVSFYRNNQSAQVVSDFLGGLAVVFLVFFAAYLRVHLRNAGAEGLAALTFGGALLLGVGGASFSGIGLALADVPNKLDPSAAQALNLLSSDFFFPFLVGTAVFMIGSGLAVARTRTLPRWLGWIAVLLGVVALTPIGYFAFYGVMAWVLVLSVFLFLKSGQPGPSLLSTLVADARSRRARLAFLLKSRLTKSPRHWKTGSLTVTVPRAQRANRCEFL
jgi:hypothetical protein